MTEKLTQLDSPLLAHIHKDATGLYNGITGNKEWATEIRRLAAARDAVILAHNYELPEIPRHSRLHRGLPRAFPHCRKRPTLHHRVLWCALHGRNRQNPLTR